MTPVSAAFLERVSGSHQAFFRVEVIDRFGAVVRDLSDALLSGSVTVDVSSSIRRRCALTFAGPILLAGGLTYGHMDPDYGGRQSLAYQKLVTRGQLLSPVSAYELRVLRGVLVDGEVEWVPLGVFNVGSARVSNEGDVAVSGFDRSRRVSLALWERALGLKVGMPAEDVIAEIVMDRLGVTVPVVAVSTGALTLRYFVGEEEGGNPWSDIESLAEFALADVSFGPDGELRILPIPDIERARVVHTFVAGSNGTVLSRSLDTDDAGVFNGVIVTIEHPDFKAAVRVEAWDENPASPTYYLGPFGKRPAFVKSKSAENVERASAFAHAKLSSMLGIGEELSISAVPNPALEAGDAIRVVDDSAGLDAVFLITSIQIPLDVSKPMQITAKRRVEE